MCSKKDYKKMYQNVTKVLFNYGITDAYYLFLFILLYFIVVSGTFKWPCDY